MRTFGNLVKVAATAAVLAVAAASSAQAAEEAPPANPLGCKIWSAPASSTLIGKSWSLKQRDDGYDWSGPWTVVFSSDGTWTSQGSAAGNWCQNGDVVIFSFSNSPHTSYRGQVSSMTVSGYESWNEGGTGIFEMTIAK